MRDEEYVYRQGVKEAASIARNARYRRTHNGKSGRVRFPSDYLTNKERNAMNGNVESYRLNDPMSWDEFKKLPDDLKVSYIKLLREKYDVPDIEIGKMMGVSKDIIHRWFKVLGLLRDTKRTRCAWDTEGWLAFVHGAPIPADETPDEEPAEVPEAIEPEPVCEEKKKAIPNTGTMTFEGSTESILETLAVLLGGGKCTHQCYMGCTFW